jgi:hypothetical protein
MFIKDHDISFKSIQSFVLLSKGINIVSKDLEYDTLFRVTCVDYPLWLKTNFEDEILLKEGIVVTPRNFDLNWWLDNTRDSKPLKFIYNY